MLFKNSIRDAIFNFSKLVLSFSDDDMIQNNKTFLFCIWTWLLNQLGSFFHQLETEFQYIWSICCSFSSSSMGKLIFCNSIANLLSIFFGSFGLHLRPVSNENLAYQKHHLRWFLATVWVSLALLTEQKKKTCPILPPFLCWFSTASRRFQTTLKGWKFESRFGFFWSISNVFHLRLLNVGQQR